MPLDLFLCCRRSSYIVLYLIAFTTAKMRPSFCNCWPIWNTIQRLRLQIMQNAERKTKSGIFFNPSLLATATTRCAFFMQIWFFMTVSIICLYVALDYKEYLGWRLSLRRFWHFCHRFATCELSTLLQIGYHGWRSIGFIQAVLKLDRSPSIIGYWPSYNASKVGQSNPENWC